MQLGMLILTVEPLTDSKNCNRLILSAKRFKYFYFILFFYVCCMVKEKIVTQVICLLTGACRHVQYGYTDIFHWASTCFTFTKLTDVECTTQWQVAILDKWLSESESVSECIKILNGF